MDLNLTEHNSTLNNFLQVINVTNTTLNNVIYEYGANNSDVPVKDLYEEYRFNEKHRLLVYRIISYVIAVLIILSNLSVVISSGLILKKGQKPKSTYLLLGNVSLADTIVGMSIVYGLSVDVTLNANPMCIFQTGILVSPAIVSIFSVGFIAVDRYIYILHGLYYQRWFNTTRVRIGIVLIWIVSTILGFLPATGWVNHELALTRCIYVGLFPGVLILTISVLSIIPIIAVAVLYTIILVKALKTVKTINNTIKTKEICTIGSGSIIRFNRRTFNARTERANSEENIKQIKRSSSFDFATGFKPEIKTKSKSTDDINLDVRKNRTNLSNITKTNNYDSKVKFESEFSVCTIESKESVQRTSVGNNTNNNLFNQYQSPKPKMYRNRKIREPKKWRAIKVVMLTTASLVLTWMPFFVTVTFYVFCEEKLTNPKCIHMRALLGGPVAILAFVNSILNPLIYAWWHKGFQKSAKAYYRQYLHRYVCRVVR